MRSKRCFIGGRASRSLCLAHSDIELLAFAPRVDFLDVQLKLDIDFSFSVPFASIQLCGSSMVLECCMSSACVLVVGKKFVF